MIATQHPVLANAEQIKDLDLRSCVHVGKVTRIQDGFLAHTHAQPRNKYEGVHFVVANCTLQRCTGSTEFELVGDVGKSFLARWNDVVHQQICKDHSIPFFSSELSKFRVNTKKTRWYRYTGSSGGNGYRATNSATIHEHSQGFAVIMTRGAWFHASKRNVHTSWHLVEWISV
jgi:hypothetical protein